MIIGMGFHARRIYIPRIIDYSKNMPIKLSCGVDLISQSNSINEYISTNKYSFEPVYLDNFDIEKGLTKEITQLLNSLVKKHSISGVIISTEPLTHKVYAEWALENGLHILMDKPISIRNRVNTDQFQAEALIDDYTELLSLYNEASVKKDLAFTVNVQRRYDKGFDEVIRLITETKDKFNIPVTSIQAMHADGTWVFPKELLDQESHPYKYGYGKCAHSGYHIFDMIWQFYKAGSVTKKKADTLEVFSSQLNPSGFNTCISEEDYSQYFGSLYESTGLSREEYENKVEDYGELDSFSILRLLKDGENICNISVSLLHSSFSRRSWATPDKDLYKGNGRVKHQQFIIQQGPFQSIHIHNYQSKHQHDVDNSDEFSVGGNNHFDIYVFRNVAMFGEGKSFYKISSKELESKNAQGLTIENVKGEVILEFLNFMLGKICKKDLKSNIDTHYVPVKILSGIYQSNVKLKNKQNPLIKIKLE